MDLSTIEKNIKKKQYGSTEAFLMDVKWILHNCIIFNSLGSKLTAIAKSLVKVCKHEMQEIENCPDCYLNAHTRKDSWFVAACVSYDTLRFFGGKDAILFKGSMTKNKIGNGMVIIFFSLCLYFKIFIFYNIEVRYKILKFKRKKVCKIEI